ncbi:MAG TPA: PglZ domain-containing protein [Armatimonadetes bacterium]|nr:PglZ domain-containing protein [Armatimonadota bacterium]
MDHALHERLRDALEDKLAKRWVVVWYDDGGRFAPFLDELPALEPAAGETLARVQIGTQPTRLARYEGSYFALRLAVEPYVAGPEPAPLLIYVPEAQPAEAERVLLELGLGGETYVPEFGRLARAVLRKHHDQATIDGLMASPEVSYADVVALLGQATAGGALLRLILTPPDPLDQLAMWLVRPEYDARIEERVAGEELRALVREQLGLDLEAGGSLGLARAVTERYVLVNEFRDDLRSEAPAALAWVPAATRAEQRTKIRALADRLRHDYRPEYVVLADRLQAELELASLEVDPAALGGHNTFRFEDEALLGQAGGLLAEQRWAEAGAVIEAHEHGFWPTMQLATHDPRAVRWPVRRHLVDLGLAVEAATPRLQKMPAEAGAWVRAYTKRDGWHVVDRRYRELEAQAAVMADDPAIDGALRVVRQAYQQLLERMATGFTAALVESNWALPGVLPQTKVFADVVRPSVSPVAFFMVDALRYEMGVRLADQISGAVELELQAAAAALPTVTQIGMAALLPGAATDFTVVEAKGQLVARIGSTELPDAAARLNYLAALVPGTVDLLLPAVAERSIEELRALVSEAPLVVVRSTEIDTLGETDNDLIARAHMDSVIGRVAQAVRRLAEAGVGRFVVSADHGHLLAARLGADQTMDNPGGEGPPVKRRYWAGRGGSTPAAAVRVTGSDLGYVTPLEFIFPAGTGIFAAAGGGQRYHHGGPSLQELIVPVLSFRLPPAPAPDDLAPKVQLSDYPEQVNNLIIAAKLVSPRTLLHPDPQVVRVALWAGTQQVGEAVMASGGSLDEEAGTITLEADDPVQVGLRLFGEAKSVQIVVLDAATDAVLARSKQMPVKLGIR